VPQLSFLCGSLGEKLTAYYCVEDYPSFPGINKEYIRKLDEETSKKADIIFATSQGLLDKKKDLYKSVVYSPHAVDFAHFNKAGRQGPLPEEIKNIKKPVIGMFGLIEERLDLELLKYLACLKPEWSILVIGKVMVDIEEFTGLKNVFFIGHRPYEDLPDYARAFDVSIIAFKQDERVKYINPLKLKEYLAMGKPVVSTPMKEAERYSDVIEIARTKEEFLGKIELLLKSDTEQMRQKRIKRVENESWESVAAKAIAEAERILTEKSR